MLASWGWGHLQMFGYDLIMIDPPWDFELYSEAGAKKSAKKHYDTMPLDEIKALRVGDLARSDTLLLTWGIAPMLPQCIEAVGAWGFTYKSEVVWIKTTKRGKIRMGPGYRVRTMHEPLIVATLGNPKHKPLKSVLHGIARRHSEKPEEIYPVLEACMPMATRADVFSRRDRPGWDSWGKEKGKFNEPVEQPALL